MDEKDNRVVGNLAWVSLAVLMAFFILYGLLAPRAYGYTITPSLPLEHMLVVGKLPYCKRNGVHDFRATVAYPEVWYLVLPLEIRSKVVIFLENQKRFAFAEEFRNAVAVVAVVRGVNINTRDRKFRHEVAVFYFPVNQNTEGEWCSGLPIINNPTMLPDSEVLEIKELQRKKLMGNRF